MNKVRYVERKYLCKYDLTEEFFLNIGLEVYDVTPLRKLYILDTNKGKKILKRVEYGVDKIDFIYNSLKYINKTFPNTIQLDEINNKSPYFKWNDDIYILMDVIQGREVAFTNELEVELCGQVLAKYHKSGQGIKEYVENKLGIEIKHKDIKANFEEALKTIEELYKRVIEYSFLGNFDRVFIKNYENIKRDIVEAIDVVNKIDIEDIIKKEDSTVLCHNDLAHHNFLINEGVVTLLDFDYSKIDLRAYDVEDFLVKSIKNAAYDIDKGINALKAYNDSIKLDKNELVLILGLITFPKEIYTLVRDYYFKRKDWDEESFLSKIGYKIDNEVYRKEFCSKLKSEYNL